MATRSTLFLKPKFGGVTPPSAGGAYAKRATVPALTSTIAPPSTGSTTAPSTPATITSPGTGTATLPNVPAKTSSGGINISDVLKTAAVVGGGAALINAIKDGIKDTVKTPTTPAVTKPTTSVVTKPTTTTPTTPKVPPITVPTEPSSPTVPTAPVYQYPTDKNGETPYDDEGNLKPGWELDENNDPVHVGISTPATPTTGGGGLNQTSTGGGGNTPINPNAGQQQVDLNKMVQNKVDNSTSDEETTKEPTPEDVTDIDMDLAGNTTPVENVDPNYSDTGEEVQDWQKVNNDPQDYITGEQTLRENLPTGGLNQLTPKDATPEDAGLASPPSDTVEVPVARGLTPPATIENEEGPPLPALPPENEETNAVDENGFTSYAQDADGNIYGVGPDGQYYLVQEATPPEDVATTPDESGFVGYAQDDAGNTYGMDAEGNYYLVSEAVVDTSYDPNQYVDNTDPYVDTTADYVEPDYSNYDTVDVRKGGLVAMKNGGGIPRYATGDSVYSDTTEDMQPWQNVDAIDQNVDQTAMGDAPTTYQDPDYPDLNDSAGNTYVWNGTEYVGADKASMAAPEDQPLTDEDGNSYAKDDTGNYNLVSGPAYNAGQNPPKATATNTSNSPLTSVKNFLSNLDPATAAIGGALLAQLLKKSSIGGGGSHYTPNMADYAIKPHTTDFGIGPARVVASQGNDQPAYSPEQAAQLNTMLGVSGYDIQHEEPVPEAPAGGLAAVSTAPTQTQEPAPEEQPMAMGGLADATHYGYGNPVDPLEMLGVRNAPQSASPTGQAIKKGGLPKPVGPLGVPMKAGRHDYRQGSYVEGPGDGQSDDIPAMLADGEYVIDAELVSMLGNGSNKAGAKVLDKFRQSVREHKRSAPSGKIPPKTKSPLAYLKGLQ